MQSSQRRICRLADRAHKDVDLTQYTALIIDTINKTIPGKNPEVFQDHYATDLLTHSEAIKLGQALVKIPELKQYGRAVTQYRLFAGRVEETQDVGSDNSRSKGGRKS